MRRRLLQGLIASCAVLATAAPAQADPIEIGHIPECTELLPAAIAPPSSERQALIARVLLDGVDQAQAEAHTAQAALAYDGVGIDFAVDAYEAVAFDGTDAASLIDQAKAHFGGSRPPGTHVVYVLTAKDIELDGQTAVAGLADCIGGVAFPDRAFAVGEVIDDADFGGFNAQLTAKVFAHEIGHLMGAHHHYANCAEGIPSETTTEPLSLCTLMFNDVGATSLVFSTVNSLVVRGHQEAYAG